MSQNIFDELRFKKHDEDFCPKKDGEPTGAKAGSLEKLFVIANRVEKGEQLFHPGDNPLLATISEEFEKASYINRIFKARIAERQHTRRAKHA